MINCRWTNPYNLDLPNTRWWSTGDTFELLPVDRALIEKYVNSHFEPFDSLQITTTRREHVFTRDMLLGIICDHVDKDAYFFYNIRHCGGPSFKYYVEIWAKETIDSKEFYIDQDESIPTYIEPIFKWL